MSEAEQAREPQGDKNGRLLAGRYRLGGVLGRGGMGTVWRADDETLGRTVAVKELRFPGAIDEDEKRRLITRTLREAKAIARIRNNSAVTVYDVVDEDDRPWIVMELVEGKSLAEAIREDGTLTPKRAAEVGLAILDVLRSAHRQGILHRDVKPSNVLIAEDGRVVLTDFGIAQVEGDPSVTSTGMLVGAPSYISPERARGHKPGPPADLWSLGGLLYASVEGSPPYDKGSAIATLTAVMTEPLDPPKNAGPLTEVIYGLLARDPDQRLDDAGARALLNKVINAPDAPAVPPADSTQVMALPVVPADAEPGAGRAAKAAKAAKPPKQTTGASSESGPGEGTRDRLRGALRSVRGAKAASGIAAGAAGAAAASASPASASQAPASQASASQASAATGSPVAPPKPATPPGTPGDTATKASGPAVTTALATGSGSAATPAGSGAASGAAVPPQRPPTSPATTRASITDVVPRRTLAIIAAVVALAILGTVLALTLGGDDKADTGNGKGDTAASAGAAAGGSDDEGEGGGQKEGQGAEDGKATGDPSGDPATGDPKTDDPGTDDPAGDDPKTDEPGGSLPAGYEKVTDDRFHFTMAMPGNFRRTGIAGSNSGGIYNAERGSFPRVQVDFNGSPKDDAAAAWSGAVASVKLFSDDYKHIGIEKVEYNGYPTVADWTFERSHNGVRVRVVNRGFKVDAQRGYSIMISCKVDEWDGDACRTLRETAYATFTPTK
ncbi:serine/threonine-protein kinase [Streptomyces sp. NPDC089173]|uniref:serine/threonine-protein kinase n=1 Tax=Streptomyces sp. NPDC089173 TaxID=3154965 RepID=UPI00344E894A